MVVEHYHLHPEESLGIVGSSAHGKAVEFTRNRVEYLLQDYKFLYGRLNDVSPSSILHSFTDVSTA